MSQGPAFFSYDNGTAKNRLGIDDAEALSLIERDLTHTRTLEIADGSAPLATRSGRFDLDHLRAIHRHLFQDIYEWAGTTRNHDLLIEGQRTRVAPIIHKDDGRARVPFVPSTLVDRSLNRTLAQLQQQQFLRELPRAEFADRAAQTFAEINNAHPFMEGNGRTQREFMVQLAAQAGHPLNFDVVSAERMSVVSLEARQGDLAGMQRLFREISDPGRVAALEKAIGFLEKENVPWQEMYIATATPGQQYSAVVALSSPEVTVMRAGGDVIVAQTNDVQADGNAKRGQVQFTAGDYALPEQDGGGSARTRQIDLEL